jgi:hypothetical protein
MFHSNGIWKPSNNYFRWRRSKNEDPIEVDRARHGSGVVVVGMAFGSHPIISSGDGDRNMNLPSTRSSATCQVAIGDAILGVQTLPETQVDNGRSCLIAGDEITPKRKRNWRTIVGAKSTIARPVAQLSQSLRQFLLRI